ncbi:MAG: histidine kinase dimerization/phospho-acceptor domain-containing protein [Stagnimonas sp.]|nr:histidine kinase dimerization/phospho-acceptor domain-containing protein [Stagnimonas sp.]
MIGWWQRRRPPRLWLVLVALNGLLLLLPVLGFSALRLYESALIRQTESELTAQGVVIAAAYRALLEPTPPPPLVSARWQPFLPQLDLARDPVRSPLPEPTPAGDEALDPAARTAGQRLLPILAQSQHHTLAALRVTDAQGRVIAATNESLIGTSLLGHPEVREALAGRFSAQLHEREVSEPAGFASISRTGGLRVVVAVPIASGDGVLGAVELLRTPANIWQVLWAKRVALSWAALALLTALALVTALSLRLILRPLQALTRSAQAVAGGRAFQPPAQRGLAEFAQLGDSVSQMAETLQARAGYIRDFAAHVSHEFKTPLAGILATTELLREHADMGEEQRQRFVLLIESEAARLSRLTQRLLELARAETAEAGGRCDAVVVLHSLAQRHRELGHRLRLGELPETLELLLPAEVLDASLGTLLDNAYGHGGPEVAVELRLWLEGDAACIEVVNDGPGISPGNAERLFTPFFTTGRDRGHTGLGLCIARALLRAHAGELWLESARPVRFRLRCRVATNDR